jgi:pyrimidine operon attenuation protein/uracil phosphoribosyltransferase
MSSVRSAETGPPRPEPPADAPLVLDAEGIRRATRRMAHEILESDDAVDALCLVAILRGGLPVAKLIAEHLRELCGREVPVGELDVTLYRDDVIARGYRPIPRPTRMPFGVGGRRVVLVDDVMFTGRTIRAAMDAVIDFGRPAAIQVATLVDRGHRELPIRVDFVGKNIPTARSQRVVLRERPDGQLEVVIV